jgi:lambda repressor-like predicted transcriptional regulator
LRTIQRWRVDGIPYWSADRVAIRLGIHPALIWTDWYATPTNR